MKKYEKNDREKSENVSIEHVRKVKELFHSALSGEIWVSIDELSEENQPESELKTPHKVAKLSIMTRSMLEYDKSYFSESSEAKPKDYRPYFFSYIIQMDSSCDKEEYSRLYRKLKKIKEEERKEEIWIWASFSKEYSLEWHEYQGEIESSASPIIYRERKIYISDIPLDKTTVKEISETFKDINGPTSDQEIEKKLKTQLKDVKFTSSRVYAVGNGNLIDIIGDKSGEEFHLIYDVGYHSRQNPNDDRTPYRGAIISFKSVTPNVVFLSHWDDDHIMGCVYGRSELFNCPWFAPEIVKEHAVSAKRLAAYLSKKGKLVIVERKDIARTLAKISTINSTISFYLGENKKKKTISKENCGGMVIEISTQTNGQTVESLFCGDVPYDAVKTEIWDKRICGYDNLLVPHHGSAMDYSALKVKRSARAIVCGNGSSKRPCKCHKDALEADKAGYQVEITECAKGAKGHSWIDLKLQ